MTFDPNPLLISGDPAWVAPTVLVTCPSCGARRRRTPSSWTHWSGGYADVRFGCQPWDSIDHPSCYRIFDARVSTLQRSKVRIAPVEGRRAGLRVEPGDKTRPVVNFGCIATWGLAMNVATDFAEKRA